VSIRGRLVRLSDDHPSPTKEDAVKYMLLIYGNYTRDEVAALNDDERNDLYSKWGAVRQTPGLETGGELAPPAEAKTVRATLTTDGPFPETKEALGGFFFFEADDIDAAVEVAGGIPLPPHGAVEVRPLVG
jgi:hypothetical protein